MSTRAQKVFTNTAGQVIIRGLDVALGVLTLGIITRYLGQENFGHYTTILALLQFFVVLVDFGLYLTLLRELAAAPEERAEHIVRSIVTLRVISSAVMLGVGVAILWATPYPSAIKWGVAAYSLAILSTTVITTLTALYQKHLKIVTVAFVLLLIRIAMLIALFAIIAGRGGLIDILLAGSVTQVLGCLLLIALMRKLPQPMSLRFTVDLAYTREIIKKTWPMAVTVALNLVYFKADTIFLSILKPAADVGLYGASYRVLEIVTTFPHMFMGLVMPILTEHWVAKNYSSLNSVWRKTFVFFSLITLPMVFGAWVVAAPLMKLVAGAEFQASGNILRVLIIAGATIFFGTLYTYLVLVVDRQRAIIKYFAAVAVASLVAYAVFIPVYSYWGAAWVTVATECAIVLAAWRVVREKVTLKIPWREITLITIASAIMAAALYVVRLRLSVIPLILLGTTMYSVLIVAFRVVSVRELKQLIRP